MAIPVALEALFYIMGTAAALDTMLTKPPENKLTTSASPAGGGAGDTSRIFSQGQPQPKASAVPQAVQAPESPGATAAANSLMLNIPNSPMSDVQAPTVGQSIVNSALQPQGLNVPNSPMAPPAQGMGLGQFLSGLNNSAQALAAVAPLLGLGPEPVRGIHTAGAAGGQPGQPLFQFPQRNTLAQILASLPRTYNG